MAVDVESAIKTGSMIGGYGWERQKKKWIIAETEKTFEKKKTTVLDRNVKVANGLRRLRVLKVAHNIY